MSTAAQINANRINSQSSTGPSEAGLSKIRLNALKNGLTGQTVVLPDDDLEAYVNLGKSITQQYRPADDQEARLVQSIIDSEFRLMRIPALEANILAAVRLELADDVAANLLPGQVYLKHERSIKNLNLQENRLRRNRDKDITRLEALQAARLEQEALLKKRRSPSTLRNPNKNR